MSSKKTICFLYFHKKIVHHKLFILWYFYFILYNLLHSWQRPMSHCPLRQNFWPQRAFLWFSSPPIHLTSAPVTFSFFLNLKCPQWTSFRNFRKHSIEWNGHYEDHTSAATKSGNIVSKGTILKGITLRFEKIKTLVNKKSVLLLKLHTLNTMIMYLCATLCFQLNFIIMLRQTQLKRCLKEKTNPP